MRFENESARAGKILFNGRQNSSGLLAAWSFWHWLRAPSWDAAFLAGLATGLALLTKSTWLILFGLWPLFALVGVVACGPRRPLKALVALTQVALLLAVAVLVVNLGYGLEQTCEPLGSFAFRSEALAKASAKLAWAHDFPVPLPRNYLLGLDDLSAAMNQTLPSYLSGQWQMRGWPHYYAYAALVKSPVGYLALAGAVAAARFWQVASGTQETVEAQMPHTSPQRQQEAPTWLSELVLLGPAVSVFMLVSSHTAFNHHFRYVLPALPFVYVWMSQSARWLDRRTPLRAIFVVVMASWAGVSVLANSPHWLSYFNEPAGGMARGGEHLVDSNIDWGQDLLYLRDWLNEHPEARPLRLAYFGNFDPRVAGIEFEPPPPALNPDLARGLADVPSLLPGYYAVSENYVRGYDMRLPDGRGGWRHFPAGAFTYFQKLEPIDRLGGSILVYQVLR